MWHLSLVSCANTSVRRATLARGHKAWSLCPAGKHGALDLCPWSLLRPPSDCAASGSERCLGSSSGRWVESCWLCTRCDGPHGDGSAWPPEQGAPTKVIGVEITPHVYGLAVVLEPHKCQDAAIPTRVCPPARWAVLQDACALCCWFARAATRP